MVIHTDTTNTDVDTHTHTHTHRHIYIHHAFMDLHPSTHGRVYLMHTALAVAAAVMYLIKAVIQLCILPLCEGMQAVLCCHAQQGAVEHQVLIRALRLPLACSSETL